MEARSPQPYPCGDCSAAGADIGDLETHVLYDHPEHRPKRSEHWTPRITAHVAKQEEIRQTREAIAQAAGISVDQLRTALKGL